MRVVLLSALPAALLAAACARVPPLQAAGEGQAIDGAPNEAQAEVAGVAVLAAVGGWRGRPQDLEQRLTPVDVTVHNLSGRPIRLGPETFRLLTPSGELRVLDQAEAAFLLRDLYGPRARRNSSRVRTAGGPTFPGFDGPENPWAPWARSPPGSPVPPPSQWYEMQSASGLLDHGSRTSILLFFAAPARTLSTATFEVQLLDEEGGALGKIEMPFARD